MITVRKASTIAGLSELRTKSEAILKELKGNPAEDYILGCLARKRDTGATPKDFVPLEKW